LEVPKIVVLDVDGTLMDTNYLHVEAWARAFEEVGHRVPRAELHKQVGKGSDLLIQEFVDDEEVAGKIDELHSEFYAELQVYGHPLPGAKELIPTLGERGYEVWFVTSAKDEELEHHMSELEAEGKLSGVVNSSAVENSKPAPDIFELTLKKAGASSEETVAVGDAIWDIESASAAGIRTVAVLTGGAFSKQELEEAGAVEVYENCAALLESGFPD
jgi:HAD superfamily hydrolase (TIGR01509 family)